MMKDKKDIGPVLLKFGVVLAFSLGGFLYSIFRTKRIKLSGSPSSNSQQSPENRNQEEAGMARTDDDHVLHNGSCSDNLFLIEPGKDEATPSRSCTDNGTISFLPSKKSNGDNDLYLLPEFDDLLKEFDLATIKASCPYKDTDMSHQLAETNEHIGKGGHREEIRKLRNMVEILKEREGSLEIQLLEYYGLKEQETAVMELQNRIKLNNMEAKLFNLKIESLQADKTRLEAEVANYAKVVSELEAAKAKIKLLKKKLRSEAEQNKEHILVLKERVAELKKQESKAFSIDSDVQLKLQKLKDVEEDAQELRKTNHCLRLENSALAEKLEHLQDLATSLLEDKQKEVLKEESQRLRQQNEDLAREIERLQADRCSDIEELVYLRWLNACLRYELRNYQPGHGKTVARDLSNTLSPKSEEKAKKLILEYAQKEGTGEMGISIADFDFDQWSSSQASHLTDSGEFDDSSDNSSHGKLNTSGKLKVLKKIMKVLHGKESHHHRRSSSLEAFTANEDMAARSSCGSPRRNPDVSLGTDLGSDGLNIRSRTSRASSVPSVDLQRSVYHPGSSGSKGEDSKGFQGLQRRRSCDVYRTIGSISGSGTDSPQEDMKKSELVKYAGALKDSRQKPSVRGRIASFSSF